MLHSKYLAAALTAFLAAVLLLASLAGPVAQAQNPAGTEWSRIAGVPAAVEFEDVFLVDETRGWAVGIEPAGGVVYRFDLQNGVWQATRDTGDWPADFQAVAAVDREQVWVVGGDGLIIRRDAQGGWTSYGKLLPGGSLSDIQMLGDGREGWAGGTGVTYDEQGNAIYWPAMLRFRDNAWQRVTIEGDGSINALHLAPGGGWAVGYGGEIWRYDGGSWRLEQGPDFCGGVSCVGGYQDVRALDAERAIAVGDRRGTCPACRTQALIAIRDANGWRDAFPRGINQSIVPDPPQQPASTFLYDVHFRDPDNGMVLGGRSYPGGGENFVLHVRNGEWQYEQISRDSVGLWALSLNSGGQALVVGRAGVVGSYGYGFQWMPMQPMTMPVGDPQQPGVRYFGETGHTLRGVFRDYWEQNGGLTRFGYPRTEEYVERNSADGQLYTVQYFERARFEYHPENVPPYNVLLGLLGNTITEQRREEIPFQPTGPSNQPGAIYFPETGHNMAPEFVGAWQRGGGLPIYGYPISEAFREVNQADGEMYLVQYFERNRFEYHPENAGTQYEVLFGLLGNEILRDRSWIR